MLASVFLHPSHGVDSARLPVHLVLRSLVARPCPLEGLQASRTILKKDLMSVICWSLCSVSYLFISGVLARAVIVLGQ